MCNELIHVHACCIPFCKPSTNVCNQIQYCLGKVAQILTQKQQSYTRNHTTLCLRVCMFQFSCRFAFFISLSSFKLDTKNKANFDSVSSKCANFDMEIFFIPYSSSNHRQRSGRNLADGHAIPGSGLLLTTWQTPTLGFRKQERQLRTGSTGGCLRSIAQRTHSGACSYWIGYS